MYYQTQIIHFSILFFPRLVQTCNFLSKTCKILSLCTFLCNETQEYDMVGENALYFHVLQRSVNDGKKIYY